MKTILFVDDESRILDGIRRTLYPERNRWKMQFALGGEDALQQLQRAPLDIVVSDMRMPGMDGATFLAKVQEISPITLRVILSGHAEVEAAMRVIPVAHRFLSKPCNASVLRTTLERLCSLQDLLPNPELRRVVSGLRQLPSGPRACHDLNHALADPAGTIDRVAKVIANDVAMSARLLQFANNAFFGSPQTVNNVSEAVACLGTETIRNLMVKGNPFCVLDASDKISSSAWDRLQQHSLRAARLMTSLPVDETVKEGALIAGLLHDIGELALSAAMPDLFATIQAKAEERKCETFIVEEELLGCSHAEIGAFLVGIWGLPYSIVDAIANHHHPTRVKHSSFDLVIAIYVADVLERQSVSGALDAISGSEAACLAELGFTEQFAEWQKSLLPKAAATAGA